MFWSLASFALNFWLYYGNVWGSDWVCGCVFFIFFVVEFNWKLAKSLLIQFTVSVCAENRFIYEEIWSFCLPNVTTFIYKWNSITFAIFKEILFICNWMISLLYFLYFNFFLFFPAYLRIIIMHRVTGSLAFSQRIPYCIAMGLLYCVSNSLIAICCMIFELSTRWNLFLPCLVCCLGDAPTRGAIGRNEGKAQTVFTLNPQGSKG